MRDEQIFHKFKPKHLLHSRFILEGIDKQSRENEQRDRRSSVDNSIRVSIGFGFGFRFLVSDSFLLLFYCPDGDSLKNHQQNNLLNFDSDNRHRVGSGLLFSASCH